MKKTPFEFERRKPMSRSEFSDGNGGRLSVYSFNLVRWRAWLTAIAALMTILGLIFAAARFGVRGQVRDELEYQLKDPNSQLNLQIDTRIRSIADIEHERFNANLWEVMKKLTTLEVEQTNTRLILIELHNDLKAHMGQ